MGIQFDNPVTGGLPAKDGILAAMTHEVTAADQTIVVKYRSNALFDLKPTTDYALTEYDKADATCLTKVGGT